VASSSTTGRFYTCQPQAQNLVRAVSELLCRKHGTLHRYIPTVQLLQHCRSSSSVDWRWRTTTDDVVRRRAVCERAFRLICKNKINFKHSSLQISSTETRKLILLQNHNSCHVFNVLIFLCFNDESRSHLLLLTAIDRRENFLIQLLTARFWSLYLSFASSEPIRSIFSFLISHIECNTLTQR